MATAISKSPVRNNCFLFIFLSFFGFTSCTFDESISIKVARTLAHLRLDTNRTVQAECMRLGHREAKTRAWDILIQFHETFEDSFLICCRDTLTSILHPDAHTVAQDIISQSDTTLCGELDGILYQIVENLKQFLPIGLRRLTDTPSTWRA